MGNMSCHVVRWRHLTNFRVLLNVTHGFHKFTRALLGLCVLVNYHGHPWVLPLCFPNPRNFELPRPITEPSFTYARANATIQTILTLARSCIKCSLLTIGCRFENSFELDDSTNCNLGKFLVRLLLLLAPHGTKRFESIAQSTKFLKVGSTAFRCIDTENSKYNKQILILNV